MGQKAKQAMDIGRETISEILDIEPCELVFTSSATEANNLVLRGVLKCKQNGCTIVTTAIEHPSVAYTCKDLNESGVCKVHYIPVDGNGLIDLNRLKQILQQDNVALVSVIGANNVTGVIQPIKQISDIVHHHNSMLHVDMTQLVGKVAVHPKELGIDFMSFSGHKFHCFRGIGALFIDDCVSKKIKPCITGGSHEHGVRAGTENVPGIVMMAACLDELVSDEKKAWDKHMAVGYMRDYIQAELLKIPGAISNSMGAPRLLNTLSMCLPNIDSKEMVKELNEEGICIGVGSACSNLTRDHTDHVLTAMGVSEDLQRGTIRISLCTTNTMAECKQVAKKITDIHRKLIKLS
jgi:cysteine desulfurase